MKSGILALCESGLASRSFSEGGISLMVERQFSKLRAGVRFSYPALLRSV